MLFLKHPKLPALKFEGDVHGSELLQASDLAAGIFVSRFVCVAARG